MTGLYILGCIVVGGLIGFAFGIKNARLWDDETNTWVRKEDEKKFNEELKNKFKERYK